MVLSNCSHLSTHVNEGNELDGSCEKSRLLRRLSCLVCVIRVMMIPRRHGRAHVRASQCNQMVRSGNSSDTGNESSLPCLQSMPHADVIFDSCGDPDAQGHGHPTPMPECTSHSVSEENERIPQTEQHLADHSIPLCIMIGKQIVPVVIPNDEPNSQNQNDHMEEFTFVDGLVWQQNPDPENAAKYSGPVFRNTVPHGRGILQFANGDVYDGPFEDGLMHGSGGILITKNGSIFVGDFVENLKHGHGKQTIKGKLQRYLGNYERGIPHGYGEAYNTDGSLFHRGQWENGTPSHAMAPFYPLPVDEDDKSTLSAVLLIACDASFDSTIGPRISRYDPLRKLIPPDDDDSSIASDSWVSEITSSIMASESFFGSDHDDLSLYDDEDCPYRKSGSILSLGPMHEKTSESKRHHMGVSTIEMSRYASLDDPWRPENVPELKSLHKSNLYRGTFDSEVLEI